MKRDLHLLKRILTDIEEHPEPVGWIDLEYDGIDPSLVSYHIKLLYQAGLVEAEDQSDTGGLEWVAKSLTWHGHEFLDAAKNDTAWNKTKSVIAKQGGSIRFSVLGELLKEQVRQVFVG